MIYAALSAAVIVAAAVYYIVFRFFKLAFCRDDRERTPAERMNMPWTMYIDDITDGELGFFDLPAQQVQIKSFDGLTLRALLVRCEGAKGTVIMMHGYRSDGFADFSTVFSFYRSLGFNLLLPHQRAHLSSEGKYITFGLKERYDCLEWARYVERELNTDIWLLGISMGAATVMMACDLGLPGSVKGIIADCGFTSPWDELTYVLRRDYSLPAFPLMYLVDHRLKRLSGVSLRQASCVASLKRCTLPVLFIHGSSDRFVPCDMTYENHSACVSPKHRYISPGADHAVTSWVDPGGYKERVSRFISRYSGDPGGRERDDDKNGL